MTGRLRAAAHTGARAVRAFWLAPASPTPAAFLRLALGSLALVQLIVLWPYLLALYGNHGYIQWAVVESSSDAWLPSIGKLALSLGELGVSSATTVHVVFGVYGACLVGLLIGYRTKLFSVLAWLGHGVTLNSGFFSLYGADTMLHILFFYLLFAPAGARWSLDAYLGRVSAAPSSLARIGQRLVQLHLCIVYLNTGLAKSQGDQWWNGEAIWRSLMQPQFQTFDFSWLAGHPTLATVAGWSVLVLETGYSVLVWIPATRRVALVSILAMHVGIALTMNLWFFSLTMITFNVAAFGWSLRSAQPVRRAAAEPARRLTLAGAAGS